MRLEFLAVGAVLAGVAFGDEDLRMRRLTGPVEVDGDFREWKRFPRLEFGKVNVDDLKPEYGALAWDDKCLYAAFRVYDTKVVNTNALSSLAMADAMELRFCAGEDRRDIEYRLTVSPASGAGCPAMKLERVADGRRGLLTSAFEGDASPVRWKVKKDGRSWSVEAAVPFAMLGVKPALGLRMPFVMIGWDRDRADKDEWGKGWRRRVETGSSKKGAKNWPSIVFGDEKVVGVRHEKNGLRLERHDPCNMFDIDEEVAFALKTRFAAGSRGRISAVLSDAYGGRLREWSEDFTAGKDMPPLKIGRLARGYYELDIAVRAETPDGTAVSSSDKATFGVMEQPRYDLETFMKEKRRFGLKWWGGVSDHEEAKRMLDALGLNWSRAIFREAVEITTNTDIQCIVKVERFPRQLYDEVRYGPIEEWEKKFGRGGWSLKTVPDEAGYERYLREQISGIPAGRNVFEIWNEPWDKLNAEDFSVICRRVAKIVRELRPDAVLGPNLKGDMSKYGYDAAVIAAGGMDGMNMVCLHPYAESEDRARFRAYKKWISERCGRDIPVYITEYGSHSCKAGPGRRSEREQAAMVVRQSLCLYAEDCKALVPHWVGQSERNPVYHEDWFGYVRKNLQAKPVLVAHANCARLIDASEYAGDLWFGPGLAAMLFRRDGKTTLALYGKGGAKEFELELPAEKLTLVDLFGGEREIAAAGGRFRVTVGGEPVFLTGLPGDMTGSGELRPDRFPKPAKPPRTVRKARRLGEKPVFDGKLGEWSGATELAMLNVKVNGDDASGIAKVAWDDEYLYFAVDMRDNEVLNNRPRAKLYRQDSIELFVSTEPREENAGYGPDDRQFMISPVSSEGRAIFGFLEDRAAGVLIDVKGGEIGVSLNGKGWTVELGLPWSALGGFKPGKGARIAFEPRVNDADSTHERWMIDPIDGNPRPENPTVWSILEFE